MVEKLIMINWGYVLILFLLGFLTYKRKSLDALGSVVMIVMGIIIIFSAGFNWLLLILIFLILSLVATKFSKSYKKSLGEFEGRRTTKNVISNGIVAVMMAAFGGYYLSFVGGFIGAIATATADTLASEIGVLHQPRLITTFKKVEPGTDGAVSAGDRGIFAAVRRSDRGRLSERKNPLTSAFLAMPPRVCYNKENG